MTLREEAEQLVQMGVFHGVTGFNRNEYRAWLDARLSYAPTHIPVRLSTPSPNSDTLRPARVNV